MTPTVTAASRLVDDPSTWMWFDVGQLPEHAQRPIDPEIIMRPPFDRCAVCGRDADGDLFMMMVTHAEASLTLSGLTKTARGLVELRPFALIRAGDDLGLHRAEDMEQAQAAVGIVSDWLTHLAESGATGFMRAVAPGALNQARIKAGKRPFSFEWRTVKIGAKPGYRPGAGTNASPRAHDRRGHWRTLADGRRIWVIACRVGDPADGIVCHDYSVKLGAAP